MEFFLRYFVELDLPTVAVDTALEQLPPQWLVAAANKAYDRALGFMLEADPHAADDFGGAVVLLGMESAAGHGSTRTRPMAWALVGPQTARPLLEADLEVGSLGHGRSQLAVSGHYYLPGSVSNRYINRGTAQRVGEATIKEFVDRLSDLVQPLVLGRTLDAAVA